MNCVKGYCKCAPACLQIGSWDSIRLLAELFLSYVKHNQTDSESMQGTLPQLWLSCRNESMHSGVVYDPFSMMCSSCLPLLNLRRKGLKPNTSVKSVNHSLFIS